MSANQTTIDTIFSLPQTDASVFERPEGVPLILRLDSYKFGHSFAMPDDVKGKKIVGMTSYGCARVGKDVTIIPAGMQYLLRKYLTQRVTMRDIDIAEDFAKKHFGYNLFNRKAWEKVVKVYDGYLPLIIRAIPEGTPVKGNVPLYTITVLDEDLYWMSSAVETLVLRAIWYPTTIASNDYAIHRELERLYRKTGADMGLLPFALHDFGGRGVSSAETAEVGGMAHMFNFMGSDTVEGVVTANRFYDCDMAAFSVYATEHSVQTAFGSSKEDQLRYLRHQLRVAKEKGATIISLVIDGYDVYREAVSLCTELKDEIIASGCKVVFRPDSGDMMEVVPRILDAQAKAFGTTLTDKGYKKVNTVGIIQGDGVDSVAIQMLLGKIIAMGYSADNVIFGSGGALLQKVNRDNYKFAQKTSALRLEDGTWIGIAKDPVTDPGKKSHEGVLTAAKSRLTGEFYTMDLTKMDKLDSEFEDLMQTVYYLGTQYNSTTMEEIRARIQA